MPDCTERETRAGVSPYRRDLGAPPARRAAAIYDRAEHAADQHDSWPNSRKIRRFADDKALGISAHVAESKSVVSASAGNMARTV